MTTNPPILRRVYDAAALFALLNIVALIALIALLTTTGGLNREKLQGIVAVLRGDLPQPTTPLSPPFARGDGGGSAAATAQRDQTTESLDPDKDPVAEAQMDAEVLRLESERIKTELDQRLALNNSILLRVVTERERFKQAQEQTAKQEEAARQGRKSEGFRKQVAIYEALSAKVALQNLLGLPEVDEAARILVELETRKAKKIIEAAKSADEAGKMRVILQRVREVAPDRSAELESDEG